MRYRRSLTEGGTYFFTVVTHDRRKFLCSTENVSLLREAFRFVMTYHPFKIDAFVLLPDHLHCIWTLPEGDNDFSTRWRLIKNTFTHTCDPVLRGNTNISRQKKGEQAIWQRRFWEHQIRDNDDLTRHVEYIHYNPVKHGLADAPRDWEYSSFHRYVHQGIHDLGWGAKNVVPFEDAIGYE